MQKRALEIKSLEHFSSIASGLDFDLQVWNLVLKIWKPN